MEVFHLATGAWATTIAGFQMPNKLEGSGEHPSLSIVAAP